MLLPTTMEAEPKLSYRSGIVFPTTLIPILDSFASRHSVARPQATDSRLLALLPLLRSALAS